MRRVISYALFGDPAYGSAIGYLLQANLHLFPGWETVITHDEAITQHPSWKKVQRYADAGLLNLRNSGEPHRELCRSMLWRMQPIWEPDVAYCLCRDLDSISLVKDRRVTEVFIRTGAAAHVINDEPSHSVPMMGGMCSFYAPKFREVTCIQSWGQLVDGEKLDIKGNDQDLLARKVWPYVERHACAHRLRGYPVDTIALYATDQVEPINLPDVSEELQREGDSYANYIGACGFRSDDARALFLRLGKPEINNPILAIDDNQNAWVTP